MILSEEQLQEVMNQALPDIKAGLVKQFTDTSNWETQRVLRELVSKQVVEFYTAEVAPLLYKELVENKDSLISLGTVMGAELVQQLQIAITKQLQANLESSYERSKIFKALLGVN